MTRYVLVSRVSWIRGEDSSGTPNYFFFLFLGASLFSTSYSVLLLDSNAFKYKIKRLEFILYIFVSLFFGAYLLYIPPHAMSLS